MSWESLREWSESLRDRGDLVVIDEPVSTKYELAAYIKKSCNQSGPAFLFTNVEDHDMNVFGGMYGAKRRILEAVGVDSHAEGVELYRNATSQTIDPVVTDSGPVKDVFESDPDLNDIPIVHHCERDRGHYITAATLVTELPHTGVFGQGIHRMFRRDSQELTIWAPEERRIGYAYRLNEENGEPTEVAIVVGPPPSVTMGGISNVPHSMDKYSVAGAIKGEPIELVECESIDIKVPAKAEMVIEAVIHPDKLVDEGPFGEFPGCYSGEPQTPIVEVTGISRREDAIYHTALTGFPPQENSFMNWLPRSATIEDDAERAVPAVDQTIVKCSETGGNGMYNAFVSIDKRLDGDPLNVITSVLGGRSQAKYCTVVDKDIDLYDEKQIQWAMNTRVQPDEDVHTFPTMTGAPLDPSGPHRQSQKMGVDATIPLDDERSHYDRAAVPGVEDVEW